MRFLIAMLALAAPAAAQTPDWSKGQHLYVTMTNRGFIPRRVMLKRDAPYILHVTNKSDKGHNLTAKSFFDVARVSPRDQAWVAHDQITLAARQRATIHMIAPNTPSAMYAFRSTTLADAGSDFKGAFYVR